MAWICPACETINNPNAETCMGCGTAPAEFASVPAQMSPGVPVASYQPAQQPGPAQVNGWIGAQPVPPPAPTGRRSRSRLAVGIVVVILLAAAVGFGAAKLAAPVDHGSTSDSANTAEGSGHRTSVSSGDASEPAAIDEEPGSATSEPAPALDSSQDTAVRDIEPSESVGSGLSIRETYGFPLLVPDGWIATEDAPGGSSSTMTYTDPASQANLQFSYNGCVGCVDEGTRNGGDPNGVPFPEAYVPEDVTSQQRLSEWGIAYARSSPPGFSTDGLVKVINDGGTPSGAIVVEVTLPPAQHSTATQILNSV